MNPYLYGGQYGNYPQNNNYYNYAQTTQPVAYPITYTNGVIGAKAFFMNPNSTVYLIDSDTNNVLYKKVSDNQGRCSLQAFSITEIPLEKVGMTTPQVEYATKGDIERLEQILNNSLSNFLISLKGAKNDE